jgi:hypothetical protein
MAQSDGPGGRVGEKPMAIRMADRENEMRKVPHWNPQEDLRKANDRGIPQQEKAEPKTSPVITKYKGREIRAASDAMRIQQSGGKPGTDDLIHPIVRGFDPRND